MPEEKAKSSHIDRAIKRAYRVPARTGPLPTTPRNGVIEQTRAKKKDSRCPVWNRTKNGLSRVEVEARKTFVPRPDFTQANAAVNVNCDCTRTP